MSDSTVSIVANPILKTAIVTGSPAVGELISITVSGVPTDVLVSELTLLITNYDAKQYAICEDLTGSSGTFSGTINLNTIQLLGDFKGIATISSIPYAIALWRNSGYDDLIFNATIKIQANPYISSVGIPIDVSNKVMTFIGDTSIANNFVSFNDTTGTKLRDSGSNAFSFLSSAAGSINSLTAKTTPVAGDYLVIDDSQDSYAKKKIAIGSISGGVGGTGDVVGPASAVADDIVIFDSTTGKKIKDSGVKISGLEPAITTKKTAFNKDFGTASDTVAQGNDSRIVNAVPNSTTVNGHALSSNVTVSATDVGLANVTNDAQLKRVASDINSFTEKTTSVDGDVFIVEDSADSYNKKKMLKSTVFKNINEEFFNTNPTASSFVEGKVYYDKDWKTLSCEIDTDVTLQVGQEDLRRVYNNTASIITNGQCVYTTGVFVGETPHVVTVNLAQANASTTSFVLGVATQNIPINSHGFITVRGTINAVKTDYAGWSVGDVIYLSDTVAGGLTNVMPIQPSLKVRIGRVITVGNETTGVINVRLNNILALGDLADVKVPTPALNEVLAWNGSGWVNSTPSTTSASSGINFYNATPVINTVGTENEIPIATLSKIPVTTTEQTITSPAFTNNTVISSAWLYDTVLNRSIIDAGTWKFTQYISVSSVAGGRSSTFTRQLYTVLPQDGGAITVTSTGTGTSRTFTSSAGTPFATTKITASATNTAASYIQTPKGIYQITARGSDTAITATVPTGYVNESTVVFNVWSKMFGASSIPVTNTGTNYGLYDITITQGPFNITTSHKLGAITFCTGSVALSTTMTSLYNGTTRNSFFASPLSTLHNDLIGLQGGAANDMYHLTSAQETIATQAASSTLSGYINTTAQTIAGIKTFSSSPIVPTPTTDMQTSTKKYVDDNTNSAICQGRLTLETGVAVSTTDQIAKTSVYFTPYNGNKISLYNGTIWQTYIFTEKSLSLTSYTANKNYDIWIYDNAGTLTMESTIWTNDTTRATELILQDGIYCKTGALTRRYLGTIRITATTGQCEDSITKRFVWNYYNRESSVILKSDGSAHTYGTATIRYWNDDATQKVEFVTGVPIVIEPGLKGAVKNYGIESIRFNGTDYTMNGVEATTYVVGASTITLYTISGYNYIGVMETGNTSSAFFADYRLNLKIMR